MAHVRLEHDALVVKLTGLDRLWALKSSLTIPLRHVRGATPDPGIGRHRAGLKLGGARVPGIITAGTFRQDGEKIFWDVHDPGKALVIELRDETYARLVIEVEDTRETARLIHDAIRD